MKVELINPFLSSTLNVLGTMCSTKATPGKPSVKQGNMTWGAVSGLIGMASANMKGNMVVSFEEPVILSIVSNMLGEPFTQMSPDVVDAVGELTNMILGGAKREFSEMGQVFDMALPVVLVGKNVEMTQMSKGPTLVVPFSTDKGQFVIEANLVQK